MLEFSGLDWVGIGIATVLAFALGGVWYGPLFGSAWLAAIGKTMDDIEPSPAPYIISFFTALLTCVVVAALLKGLGVTGLGGGAALGAITGVGFIATAMASDNAFCGWGTKLYVIQAGYRVTYAILMGAILGFRAG